MNSEARDFYKKGLHAVLDKDYDAGEFFLLKSIEIEESELNCGCAAWLYGTVLKQEERGLRFFRQAILQNPKKGDLYNDYGALLLKMGRFSDSIKWFIKAVRLDSSKKKHFAFYNLALVYRNWKKPEYSLHCLRMALEHKPNFEEAYQLYQSIIRDSQHIEANESAS